MTSESGFNARAMRCEGYIAGPDAEGAVEPVAMDWAAVAYICPRCDRTHLHIKARGQPLEVRLDLSPQEAETIGQQLVNPPPLEAILGGPNAPPQ